MVVTIVHELQRFYEDYWPYDINNDLVEKYHKRDRQEKYEVVKSFIACKIKERESMINHMQRMQRYLERLVRINVHFDEELAIDMVLNSLPSCYDQFILAYHLNNTKTTLAQLHNLLQTDELGMKGKNPTPSSNVPIHIIGKSKGKKKKDTPKANWMGKVHVVSSNNGPKAKPSLDIPVVRDLKEATFSITMTMAIGRKVASNICKTSRMAR